MKKTHKKILGFAGLFLVTAMTVFAVFMPSPGAVAANSSVTDTIIVRVISQNVSIDITNPKDGDKLIYPDQVINYNYDHAKTITVNIKYTDFDGAETTDTITVTPDEETGSGSLPINLYTEYGYGDFVIEIIATNADGVSDRDAIEFTLIPITGEVTQEESNDVKVDLDYDNTNPDIDHIIINVYDKDGNLVPSVSPTSVPSPDKTVLLPFEEKGIPDGEYTFEIIAVDVNGEPIQAPYYTGLDYKASSMPVPDTGGNTPNTGHVLIGLNISKTDYLITGLIIFFLFSIFGTIIVAKKKQDKKRR